MIVTGGLLPARMYRMSGLRTGIGVLQAGESVHLENPSETVQPNYLAQPVCVHHRGDRLPASAGLPTAAWCGVKCGLNDRTCGTVTTGWTRNFPFCRTTLLERLTMFSRLDRAIVLTVVFTGSLLAVADSLSTGD